MIPVNQFILGGSDPLLYPGEKMTNSIMMLNLVMFMLQLTLNIMIMLNYLKNGLVVI